MTHEEASKLMDETAAKLSEHFDAVQIVASWVEEGSTRMTTSGRGNWYARQGMSKAFCDRDQAEEAADLLVRKLDPPDDSGAWKQ